MRKLSEAQGLGSVATRQQESLNGQSPVRHDDDNALFQNLIGLGAFSARKSYYPELLQKIDELEAEKERYKWLVEHAVHGIFQARIGGGISAANPSMARICGYQSPEQLQQAVRLLCRDLFCEQHDLDDLLISLYRDGQRVGFETRLRRHNGDSVPVSLNVLLKDSKTGLIEVFVHDITERKRAQATMARINTDLEQRVEARTRELQVAKQEAEAANASKDKYLAAASHDLLQPLNAARLLVATLQERELPNDNRVLVDRIHTALTGAEELLADLLDISRLDANAVTPDLEDFAARDLLNTLYSEFQPVAQQAGLELKLIDSSHIVRSDSRLLMRILRNFVSNAIRYTETGRVVLGCRRQGNFIDILVCDSGPGIADHQREEIFREFRQLDNATKGRSKGVGLGLAIVERIARMLDHKIQVKSKVGKGSCFGVRVPLTGRQQHISTPTVTEALPSGGKLDRVQVLVIDNEESIRHSMTTLLQAWGCNVITASNERLALDAWHTFQPDIILADYHLDQKETGTHVLGMLEAETGERTPAIVITADRSDPVRLEINRLGATHLNKPVKPAKLRALMCFMLGMT
jgi:PAS domain S-box-containing protein